MNNKIESLSKFNASTDVNRTDITWQVTNSSRKLKVVFESGASITVDVLTSMLAVTVSTVGAFRDQTRGLLGIFNGDVSDDFTAPDGSKIKIDSSQQEIYEKFGIHCKYLN